MVIIIVTTYQRPVSADKQVFTHVTGLASPLPFCFWAIGSVFLVAPNLEVIRLGTARF
jgi:hypothetical protein